MLGSAADDAEGDARSVTTASAPTSRSGHRGRRPAAASLPPCANGLTARERRRFTSCKRWEITGRLENRRVRLHANGPRPSGVRGRRQTPPNKGDRHEQRTRPVGEQRAQQLDEPEQRRAPRGREQSLEPDESKPPGAPGRRDSATGEWRGLVYWRSEEVASKKAGRPGTGAFRALRFDPRGSRLGALRGALVERVRRRAGDLTHHRSCARRATTRAGRSRSTPPPTSA